MPSSLQGGAGCWRQLSTPALPQSFLLSSPEEEYKTFHEAAQVAERLFHERYRQRDTLDRRMLTTLHHNLCEYESLQGTPKSTVYATYVDSDMNLVARTVCAAEDIQQNSDVF
ncbi:hypothetical protein TNCV_2978111 [Trichonephila clavipes]|nr:hypothetical protein TNCV_2978111 [Trichonephila clavipes]